MEGLIKKKVSRIVKQKLVLPEGVSFIQNGLNLLFKGPEGEGALFLHKNIELKQEGSLVILDSNILPMSILGTFVILFKNAMNGVKKKFEKILNLYGVGYKVIASNGVLEFFLGYSHSIKMEVPSDVVFEVKTPTQLILKSCSKPSLGNFVSKISKLRKVNPYKTKGVIGQGDFILKKEGKK